MNDPFFLIVNIILAVAVVADIFVVFKRDLMMLQQNSYRPERYVRWFNQNNESTTPWRLGACIALFLLLVNHLPKSLSALLALVIIVGNVIVFIKRKYKKPLVFTARATRIYVLLLALGLALPVTLGLCLHSLYLANELGILVIVLSPAFLLLALCLLSPVEKLINRKYYNEAKKILEANKNLTVIGITGSYGKTSTKHFLYHLLKQRYETLMTPGSFNTLLGVIRTVRASLKPYTRIFIAEMGAKQPGDIKEICDLVKPQIGIITSIGEQHLETFKSVENILKTKFELIESLPQSACGFVNKNNPIVMQRERQGISTVYYSCTQEGNEIVRNIRYSKRGTIFEFNWEGEWITFETPLLGAANIENLTGALLVAKYVGITPSEAKYALATMPQVEHRLQLNHTSSGLTIIDDAYNSNPVGAEMALDVLSRIGENGRTFIITPGMIELGDLQEMKNRDFGRKIGETVNFAIIVGEYNRDAIVEGLKETDINPEHVMLASDFAEAQKLFLMHAKKGDVVLYENDLPDTFH